MITSRTGIFLDKRFEPPPDGIQVLDQCDVSGMRAAMDRLPDRREVNLRSYVNTHFSPQVFRESYQALVDQACSQMHG
jgi:hypothetical protein